MKITKGVNKSKIKIGILFIFIYQFLPSVGYLTPTAFKIWKNIGYTLSIFFN